MQKRIKQAGPKAAYSPAILLPGFLDCVGAAESEEEEAIVLGSR